MDLSNFDLTGSEELELRHPGTGLPLENDEGEAMTITLVGIDSSEWRQAQRKLTNRRLSLARKGQQSALDADALEEEGIDTLVACTKGWAGIQLDGEPLPFSAENARKLYTRFVWIREQVDRFVGNRANFTTA